MVLHFNFCKVAGEQKTPIGDQGGISFKGGHVIYDLYMYILKPNGVTMEPYGAYGAHGTLWSPMYPFGALWSSMDPYGSIRPYGALWSPVDPFGTLWSLMDPVGALRSPMDQSDPMEP